jgi:hypothetical protein
MSRVLGGKAMFTPEEILARLRQKPFRPLRITAAEGEPFDIYYPDLVRVGRYDVCIGSPDPVSPTIYDRLTRVALVHIVSMEDIPAPTLLGDGQG